MTEFLVRHFVKDYEAVEKSAVRTAYGVLASMVGIVCNVFLFLVKFIVGLLLHSVSVTADAFNNLSDAASSIISFIGVKMAGKPADKEHPFGHGRWEQISALIIISGTGSGIYFFEGFCFQDQNPGNLEFSVDFGSDPDFIHRSQAMARCI